MDSFRRDGAANRWRGSNKPLWTPEEDALLLKLIMKLGPRRWESIAKHIRGKTGKSCRTRWVNQLNPEVNKAPFTAKERKNLLELHQKYGNKWSTLVRFFPGRTDNQLKNQYHSLVATQQLKGFLSSSTDCYGTPNSGSKELSRCVSESSVGNDAQSTTAPSQGNNLTAFGLDSAPGAESSWYNKCISSVYGKDENCLPCESSSSIGSPTLANIYTHQGQNHEDHMLSDANSEAVSEISPAVHPGNGVNMKPHQFIDFMGVGASD